VNTEKLVQLNKGTGAARLTAWAPPDGQLLAVAYDDRRTCVWEALKQILKTTLDATRAPITALAWTPEGKVLAAGDDGGGIYLWEYPSSKWLHECKHPGKVQALAWSPDGKQLAAAGVDGTVTLWDRDGASVGSLGDAHSGAAGPIAWAMGGASLLVLGDGPYLRQWDVDAKQVRRQFRLVGRGGQFSPDGALLAMPSRSWTLRLWETATGRPLGTTVRLDEGWLVLSEEGHYRFENKQVEKELFYVVQTDGGQQTLRPADFAAKYHWQNDEKQARLDTR
jgi:WD40 repeat protein